MRNVDKQQLAIILLAAGIITGFAVFQYLPLVRKASRLREAQAQGEVISREVDAKKSRIEAMRREHEELAIGDSQFDGRIPRERQFAQLWKQIADVMNEYGLTDQLVQPGREIEGERFCCVPLTIQGSGRLDQVFGMFQSLGRLERLLRIESVSLSNDEKYTGRLQLRTEAKVYYQRAASEANASDS